MWKTNRTTTIILTIDNDYPLYYGDVEIDVLAHPAEPRTWEEPGADMEVERLAVRELVHREGDFRHAEDILDRDEWRERIEMEVSDHA